MLDAFLAPLSQAVTTAASRAAYLLSTVPLTTLLLILATVVAVAVVLAALSLGPVITYSPKPLLTGWERRSLAAIRRALPPGWSVACQVRAADAVHIATRSTSAHWRAIRRLGLRSLDFVLLDHDTVVRAVIELDDASHRRPDRRRRDADIDHVFRAAGIPVVHVHPHPVPHWPTIVARLTSAAPDAAGSAPRTTPAPSARAVASPAAPPPPRRGAARP
ncbi:DUF2726 domain-containing protein [Azospirillum canadense]|uniref:DUF2726 domain-containing protein n=1 Tax=Azospirillum canadense TaxID=403962 RepID=UPI002227B190|nr:DUF2726 domain-containing protein [Azospirillum canadense]MCW2240346.1 very-short-patch-repair endonuclease [Azospirillum canadense]